jgi:RHS repeat-associated protein
MDGIPGLSQWYPLIVSAAPEDAHAILQFDLADIPQNARVLSATLGAHTNGGVGAIDISAHEVTQSWKPTEATWSNRATGSAWTTPGGDYAPSATATAANVQGTDGWREWGITSLVQRWVTGVSENFGVLLRSGSSTYGHVNFHGRFSNTVPAVKPYLQVRYAPPAGQRRDDTYLSEELTDRSRMGVGVASGNLLVSSRDVAIAGVGLPLELSRSYNTGLVDHQLGTFGNGGTSNLSADVRLVPLAGGAMGLHLGDGSSYRFRSNGAGGFVAADRLEADLAQLPNSTYELTYRRSQSKWRFRADGKLSALVDKNGNQIALTYTGAGLLSKITDTQGREITVTVDSAGRITELADPTGRDWKYTYGGSTGNRLTKYEDPEGEETLYAYDGSSRLRKITTPGGRITLISYDGDGRVSSYTRVTDFDEESGPTTSFTYDQNSPRCTGATAGRATFVVDPRGHRTTYCSNAQLQTVLTVDPLGRQQTTTYTSQGQVQDFTNGAGTGSALTQVTYASTGSNPTHNLTQIRGAMGETTTLGYQSGGTSLTQLYQPTSQTAPDGQQQFFGYDGSGNLSSVKDHQTSPSQQATLTHNPDGTIATAKDGKNNQTSYGYWQQADGGFRKGLLKSYSPPAPINPTNFDYDQLGRVISATDGNDNTTAYTYDDLDRVKTIAHEGGSIITYHYDEDGNQTQRTDTSGGTYGYSYDDLNRRVGETLPGSRSVVYAYDAAGNITSLTDGSGITGYGYDEANQNCYVAPIDAGGGACVTPPAGAITLTYNVLGQQTKTAYPNGVAVDVTPDASGKPTPIAANHGSTALLSRTYGYASFPGGKTGELVATTTGGKARGYTYDQSSRLATVAYDGTTAGDGTDLLTYAYDNAGNRTAVTAQSTNPVEQANNRTYAYNAANQMTGMSDWLEYAQPGPLPPTPQAHTFGYDDQGNNLGTVLPSSSSWNSYNDRNQFVGIGFSASIVLGYAGPNQSELIEDDGRTIENNLLGKGRVIDGTDVTSFVRAPDGTLLARKAPGNAWSYYVLDNLGSVIGVTDAAGALTASYDYDPDGNPWPEQWGTHPEDFGYTGAYAQTASGGANEKTLYHNGLRWYDPETARWTQSDPLDHPDDPRNANRYLYVGSDPINYVDPSGTWVPFPVLAARCATNKMCRELVLKGKGVKAALKILGLD